jgi:hypothetical protein
VAGAAAVTPGDVPRASSRRKLAIVAAALLAGVLVTELGLRWFWPGEVDSNTLRERAAVFQLETMKRYSADPVLYYEMLPDHTFFANRAKFVIDHEGYRVPDHPVEHAPDAAGAPIRFALVGPSTAFGWRIAFDDCYGEQLRRRLEARWKRPLELRDFGVPAYNSIQEARVFETRVLPWHPDFVVWNYDHRDAYPILLPTDPVGLPPEYGDNALHSATWKLLRRRLREHELEARRFNGTAYTVHTDYLTSGRDYDAHLAALQRMAGLAEQAKLPVVLFIHDAIIQRLPEDADHFDVLHRPLLEFFRTRTPQVHVLDLFPRYQAVMQERGWPDLKPWWISLKPVDAHPTPECHAFIADQLDQFIATLPEIGPK